MLDVLNFLVYFFKILYSQDAHTANCIDCPILPYRTHNDLSLNNFKACKQNAKIKENTCYTAHEYQANTTTAAETKTEELNWKQRMKGESK